MFIILLERNDHILDCPVKSLMTSPFTFKSVLVWTVNYIPPHQDHTASWGSKDLNPSHLELELWELQG